MLGIINFFFLPSQNRAKSIFEENSTWKKLFICLFLSLLMALMIFSIVYVAPQITGKENVITSNIDWITVSSFIVKDPIWNIFTFWQGAPIVNNILFVVVGAFAFFATSIIIWGINSIFSRKTNFPNNILVCNIPLFCIIIAAFISWAHFIAFFDLVNENLKNEWVWWFITRIVVIFLLVWSVVLFINLRKWAIESEK